MSTLASTLGLQHGAQHICCARQHQVERVEGLSKAGGQPMTERARDLVAGMLFMGMLVGLLLGGWAVLRLMGHEGA